MVRHVRGQRAEPLIVADELKKVLVSVNREVVGNPDGRNAVGGGSPEHLAGVVIEVGSEPIVQQ